MVRAWVADSAGKLNIGKACRPAVAVTLHVAVCELDFVPREKVIASLSASKLRLRTKSVALGSNVSSSRPEGTLHVLRSGSISCSSCSSFSVLVVAAIATTFAVRCTIPHVTRITLTIQLRRILADPVPGF